MNSQHLELREKAIALLKEKPARVPEGRATEELIEELRIYQAELEIQNEELYQTQVELIDSRNKYQKLYELAPVGYFTLDRQGVIKELNIQGSEMLKVDRNEAINKPFRHYINHEYEMLFAQYLKRVFELGEFGCELKMLSNSGSEFIAQLSSTLISDNDDENHQCLTVIMDITKSKMAEEKLIHAKEILEKANKLKSEFLGNISHEIRNPMNAIIGFAELALTTELSDDQKNYIQEVVNSSKFLLAILNDLLSFSKIESGTFKLSIKPFNFQMELKSFLETMSTMVSGKGLGFAYQIDPNIPDLLLGDIIRLQQVLYNLINNGVKFTKEGQIAVDASLESQSYIEGKNYIGVHFSVEDTGIGIGAEDIFSIFESFVQVEPLLSKTFAGVGLGLSISKSIVEAMNGKIWVESEQNSGTFFHFIVYFVQQDAKTLTP